MRRLLASALLLPFIAASVFGQDGDRFRWSWEKGTAPAANTSAGSSDQELVNENMTLKQKYDQLSLFYDEAQKANSDLILKIESLKAREAELKKQVGSGTAPPAGTDSDALTAAVNENIALKTRVAELGARLRNAEAPGGTAPAVGQNSDLFKRMERENAQLRLQIRQLRQSAHSSDSESSGRLRQNESDIQGLERELEKLRSDNELLRKVQKDLAERAVKGVELQKKEKDLEKRVHDQEALIVSAEAQLKKLREERDNLTHASQAALEERDAEIDRLRAELYDVRHQIAVAQQEAEAFLTERNNLYFDMAVLYIKSRMYRQAEREFLRLLAQNPDAADVHYNLGILYDSYLSDRKKARLHYRKFLELAPADEDSNAVRTWLQSDEEGF